MAVPASISVKDEAHKVIDRLPDDADWEDIIYALYVVERIQQGLRQLGSDDVMEHEEFFDQLEEES
jgi:hypothetical protein